MNLEDNFVTLIANYKIGSLRQNAFLYNAASRSWAPIINFWEQDRFV